MRTDIRWSGSGLLVITLAMLVGGCRGSGPAPTAQQPPADVRPAAKAVEYDRALTDAARVLAGMLPETDGRYARVTALPAWQAYHASMDQAWAADTRERRTVMADWSRKELAPVLPTCGVLLYPFGGPDLLGALELFPQCDAYVLFGLEHLGKVPQLESLPPERADRLVAEIGEVLTDLFSRHYFITSHMMAEFSTSELDGVAPVLLLVLARLDARVVGIERVVLRGDGTLASQASTLPATGARGGGDDPAAPKVTGADRPNHADAAEAAVEGWRVTFVPPGATRPKTAIYFRAQAENKGLARRPVVEAYLRHLGPVVTFMKSASYLLHDDQFSTMRTIVTEASTAILQDDTGVPYRFLSRGGWALTLFGNYSRPVKDFNYGYQKDLEAAYAASASTVRPLPFSYGYHWRDGGSCALLALRSGSPTATSH